jgi:hypothetical protein
LDKVQGKKTSATKEVFLISEVRYMFISGDLS